MTSAVWGWFQNLGFGTLACGIVGLFVLTWAASVLLWKTRRIEERWSEYIVD